MRGARLFLLALSALALAGCMHRQQAYTIIDPATGQPIPVVQSYAQVQAPAGYGWSGQPQAYRAPVYAPQIYQAPAPAPQTYRPPAAPAEARALYSTSPAAAQQSYAALATAPPKQSVYAQAAPAAAPAHHAERGLFTRHRTSAARAYRGPAYASAAPYVAAPGSGYGYASVNPAAESAYTLDAGDRLRVVVFGQDGITNSYLVGADGNVNLPLVGNVPARGFTTAQLSQMIAERLKQGYVREPHVSVEIEAYRPFFILGEVNNPGQYPYVANMTAETAVAIAGGFSPRASKGKVQLSRNQPGQQIKGDVPLNYPLRPGDTVVVKERWF